MRIVIYVVFSVFQFFPPYELLCDIHTLPYRSYSYPFYFSSRVSPLVLCLVLSLFGSIWKVY